MPSSVSPTAPEILTERLLLRAHRIEDFEAMADLWSDEEICRFILGRPSTRSETWSRLLRYAGHWKLLGFGYWAVEERQSGAYIGDVGFADFQRDIVPTLGPFPEAGWVLARQAHGRGLATEAMLAAQAWIDDKEIADRSVCIFDPQHKASIRIAEKLGYQFLHTAVFMDEPTLVMQRWRPNGKDAFSDGDLPKS